MLTVEEILEVLLACEAAVGEYAPSYGETLQERIAAARSSLLFWVAKDRRAGAREQWQARQKGRGARDGQAENGGNAEEKGTAQILQIFPPSRSLV
mgnify:CR=1 FL=1